MNQSISEKIALLNRVTLESLNEQKKPEVAKKFTEAGIDMVGADFGFTWWRKGPKDKYELAYKSPDLPYSPNIPRKRGGNYKAQQSGHPVFISDVKKEQYGKQFDVRPYMASYVIVPIVFQNRFHGSMVLCFKKKKIFTEEEKSLCGALGNAMAQAMTINRLYFNLKDFKQTLDKTLDSIFMFDPVTYKVSYVNTGALKQLDLSRGQITNKSILNFLANSSTNIFREEVTYVSKGKVHSSVFEITLLGRAKKRVEAEILLQYVASPGQPAHLLGIVRDISERKKTEEKIKHAAFHDALTGLPNRMLFTQELTTHLADASRDRKKFAILFLDLDRFKFINDILGHVVGDELLRDAAARLRNSIKQNDLVSRLGGDEFVILLRNLRSSKDTDRIAKRIIQSFQTPFKLGGQEIYVNISIGISNYPQDGRDAIRLLKNADNALYRVKQEGGNNFQHYHQGIVIPEVHRLELEKQLRAALKTDELRLYYQPVFNLKTGKLVSTEALVRWQHPEMGLILPGDFIMQAEESGLIVPVGSWIFEEACKQAQIWLRKGHRLPISINISPRQLLQQDLLVQVKKMLKKYKLPAELLELELTENFLIQNMDVSIEILKQFRALGLKVYIDDFGTGYASLNYLKRLPIDYVKIDQSFIQGAPTDPQDAGIVKAIISMGHHLKLNVVAEGVESAAQAEFLTGSKCDRVQGNFYAEPMPAEKLGPFLHKLWSKNHNFPINLY